MLRALFAFLVGVSLLFCAASASFAQIASITVSPSSSIVGGCTASGVVTLSAAAPTGGEVVSLTSSNASVVQCAASMTVMAGATSAAFNITTSSVSTNASVNLTAAVGSSSQTISVSVTNGSSPPAANAYECAEGYNEYGSLLPSSSSNWVADNGLLTGTSSFHVGYAGAVLIDLGARHKWVEGLDKAVPMIVNPSATSTRALRDMYHDLSGQ